MAYFSMGRDTHQVPMQMHARHRQRLSESQLLQLGESSNVACFFEGGSEQSKYDTDTNWDFRQESNFQWLFGVRLRLVLEVLCIASMELSEFFIV